MRSNSGPRPASTFCSTGTGAGSCSGRTKNRRSTQIGRGDWDHLRRLELIKRVDFDDGNAGGPAKTAQDRGVVAGRKRSHDGRLEVVVRRDTGIDDGLLVRAIDPVVV